MLDFKPPKFNPVVMSLCKWGLPFEHFRAQIEVQVMGDGLNRFLALKNKHVVIICNHSNQYDPEVVFTFSKLAGEDFHFMAAREVFDWVFGSVGWWFQSLGCFSVVRGQGDPETLEMARQIIADGDHKLVIFPEGEVTRSPDFLLPLRPGTARLSLEGQERLLQHGTKEPVFVQPIGIRWRYKYDITGWLDFIVRRIESKLGLKPTGGGLTQRVHAAAAVMLTVLEDEYFSEHNSDLPYETRVYRLRECILQRASALVGMPQPEGKSQLTWMRRVVNAIDRFIQTDRLGMSGFQLELHKRQADKLHRFLRDCRRVQNLIGVVEPKERRPVTQERLAEMVSHIERQVFDYVLPKGPRIAMVGVGEAIAVLDLIPLWERNREEAIETLTDTISRRLQQLIDDLDTVRRPDQRLQV
ncbi:MAG TPA: lysophospholipid acyltransferase family protein [Candidatus Obscuribacterales bacterium]